MGHLILKLLLEHVYLCFKGDLLLVPLRDNILPLIKLLPLNKSIINFIKAHIILKLLPKPFQEGLKIILLGSSIEIHHALEIGQKYAFYIVILIEFVFQVH